MQGEAVRGSFPDPGFGSLPGLERVRAYLHLLVPRPPLGHLTGIWLSQMGPGSATLKMPASPWLLDIGDTIQPVLLMEGAMTLAALTGAPPGMEVSTTTLSVNYLRPANLACEAFVARARIVHGTPSAVVTARAGTAGCVPDARPIPQAPLGRRHVQSGRYG
jgi:acyl-coenzyme A thioesterase PaaI-like protein